LGVVLCGFLFFCCFCYFFKNLMMALFFAFVFFLD